MVSSDRCLNFSIFNLDHLKLMRMMDDPFQSSTYTMADFLFIHREWYIKYRYKEWVGIDRNISSSICLSHSEIYLEIIIDKYK